MAVSVPATKQGLRVHPFRFGLRTLLVAVAAAGVVLSYVGSYYRLSRRGFAEAQDVGLAGFLYVPVDEAAATEDLSRHQAREALRALELAGQAIVRCGRTDSRSNLAA